MRASVEVLLTPRKAAPLCRNLLGSFITCHWFFSETPKLPRDITHTLLRDHGFNCIVLEYPFFMLISLPFKENGPENSVILYNDPTAISKQGQTLPLDCFGKNKWKTGTNLVVFAASAFQKAVLSAWPWALAELCPGSRVCPPASPSSGSPRAGHQVSRASSYLHWELTCRVQKELHKVQSFQEDFCCFFFILWQISLSQVRFWLAFPMFLTVVDGVTVRSLIFYSMYTGF